MRPGVWPASAVSIPRPARSACRRRTAATIREGATSRARGRPASHATTPPWRRRGRSVPAGGRRTGKDGEPVEDRTARPRRARSIQGARKNSFAEQFLVLLFLQVVDQANVLVGDLLHVVQAAPLVVLGNLVVLEEFLQTLVGVAADPANGVAAFFRVLMDEARHFLSPF